MWAHASNIERMQLRLENDAVFLKSIYRLLVGFVWELLFFAGHGPTALAA